MRMLERLQAPLASVTQETTVALDNLTLGFSLLEFEPSAEYRESGVTRITQAEVCCSLHAKVRFV
jgi:hypothetical protein